MVSNLQKISLGSVFAVFAAISTMAAPPNYHFQNRWQDNSAFASTCEYSDYGFECRGINGLESRGTKGKYLFTAAAFFGEDYSFDPNDWSWSYAWFVLECLIDSEGLRTNVNGASLDAILDSSLPGCYSDGWRESWNPTDGYQSGPYAISGVYTVSGKWADPINSDLGNTQRRATFTEPWSGDTTQSVYTCRDGYFDTMAEGGVWINDDFIPFEGLDGFDTWSSFSFYACNNNEFRR